jgi:hypothetical protein
VAPLTVEYRGSAVVKHGVPLDVYGVREIGSQRQPRKLKSGMVG